MNFRDWLATEGLKTRNKPTDSSVIDRSVLHGYAAQFGRPDTPGPIKKGVDSLVTGIGAGIASGLDRAGLVVQPTGSVLGMPQGQEKVGFKSSSLIIQIPVYAENGSYKNIGNSLPFGSANLIKKVVDSRSGEVDPRRIRMDYKGGDEYRNDGKYVPLKPRKDGGYNYDIQYAKEFTRALMMIGLMSSPPPKGFTEQEREMYDIYKPEIAAEEIRGHHLVTVFRFKKHKDAPEMLKGGGE